MSWNQNKVVGFLILLGDRTFSYIISYDSNDKLLANFILVNTRRDDMPHVANSELSTEEVIETVKNLTDLLDTVFPTTKIYPALGNHDYHPKHLMPPKPNDIYTAVGDLWSRWLPQDAVNTFKKGVSLK